MAHICSRKVNSGDIVFLNDHHLPHTRFAPALPGGCYECISRNGDLVALRTYGLIGDTVHSAKDFVSIHSIERIVPSGEPAPPLSTE